MTTTPEPTPAASLTPRTDALKAVPMTRLDSDNFARELEREISMLKAALQLGQENCDAVYNDLKRERDVARSKESIAVRALAEAKRDGERLDERAGKILLEMADGNARIKTVLRMFATMDIERFPIPDGKIICGVDGEQFMRWIRNARAALAARVADGKEPKT